MGQPPGPGARSEKPVRRRTAAALLFIGCLLPSIASCGDDEPESARIQLLPAAEAQVGTWRWSGDCRVGPHNATGCDDGGPLLGNAQLAGNAWNLGATSEETGSVRMSLDAAGTLEVIGDLSSAPPCTDHTCIAPEANTWVRGFPSVLYGIEQCHADTSPPPSPDLQLPARVDSLPSGLVGVTSYETRAPEITYTVAYDLWLNPSDTTTPCQTDGTLEVMVWTDHAAQALLPDGMRVGRATIPYAVDGISDAGFETWSVYASNVFGDGHTQPWGGTIWLVLDAPGAVQRGTVTVDLSAALDAVGSVLENTFGWRDFASSYWLDTIAFGIEFGPQNANPYVAAPADFSMRLTDFCLEVRSTVSSASC
jgi:hypothetical protein